MRWRDRLRVYFVVRNGGPTQEGLVRLFHRFGPEKTGAFFQELMRCRPRYEDDARKCERFWNALREVADSDNRFGDELEKLAVRAWTDEEPWRFLRELSAPIAARRGNTNALACIFNRMNSCIAEGNWRRLGIHVSEIQATGASPAVVHESIDLDADIFCLLRHCTLQPYLFDELRKRAKELGFTNHRVEKAFRLANIQVAALLPELMASIETQRTHCQNLKPKIDELSERHSQIPCWIVEDKPADDIFWEGVRHTEYDDPGLSDELLEEMSRLQTEINACEKRIEDMEQTARRLRSNLEYLGTAQVDLA